MRGGGGIREREGEGEDQDRHEPSSSNDTRMNKRQPQPLWHSMHSPTVVGEGKAWRWVAPPRMQWGSNPLPSGGEGRRTVFCERSYNGKQ
jgi:hypothetical protein